MVKYIRIGKKEVEKENTKPSAIRKYLAIGAAALIIGSASFEYMRNISYWKPRVHTVLSINSPESLEYRIDNLKHDLAEYPHYTDKLVHTAITSMHENGLSFSPDSYIGMFDVIKHKIECNPELLDHLGPNAMAYQETCMIRAYKNKAKDAYQSIKQKAVEAKNKLKELFAE